MTQSIPLGAWRRRKVVTQRELAKKAGVGVATVVRVEHGQPARASTIRKLARALGIPPEELVASAT